MVVVMVSLWCFKRWWWWWCYRWFGDGVLLGWCRWDRLSSNPSQNRASTGTQTYLYLRFAAEVRGMGWCPPSSSGIRLKSVRDGVYILLSLGHYKIAHIREITETDKENEAYSSAPSQAPSPDNSTESFGALRSFL